MERNKSFTENIRFVCHCTGGIFSAGFFIIPGKKIRFIVRFRECISILRKREKRPFCTVKQSDLISVNGRIAVHTEIVVVVRRRDIGHTAHTDFHQALVVVSDFHRSATGNPLSGLLDKTVPTVLPIVLFALVPRIFDSFEFHT